MNTLFYNGIIYTLEDDQIHEAILIQDDKIIDFGRKDELKAFYKIDSYIDLKQKVLMPSFIDSHSHFMSCVLSYLQLDLSNAFSLDNIIELISNYIKDNNIKEGEFVIARGYDHNNLNEKTHPSKQILDKHFKNYCVVLQHQSGHMGVFNTKALERLNVSSIDNDGYLQEQDFVTSVKKVPLADENQILYAVSKVSTMYASYGISTVQEGLFIKEMIPIYKTIIKHKALTLDMVSYVNFDEHEMVFKDFSKNIKKYKDNFKLNGYKIILDGSPQGKTAWMKTHYLDDDKNFGISSMSNKQVKDALTKAIQDDLQILIHCNGDAAIEQLLLCAESIENKNRLKLIRPVIIHAQFILKKQLKRAYKLGFIVSFFIAHCYYFAKTHIQNLGFNRAKMMSPLKSAANENILFTLHQDSPVIKPNMLETIHCAVNRISMDGQIINKQEQIEVMDAIKAVTINAAYQNSEENIKGTLKVGKKADFIILDEDIFTIDKNKIKDIKVLMTYKDGKCCYKKM